MRETNVQAVDFICHTDGLGTKFTGSDGSEQLLRNVTVARAVRIVEIMVMGFTLEDDDNDETCADFWLDVSIDPTTLCPGTDTEAGCCDPSWDNTLMADFKKNLLAMGFSAEAVESIEWGCEESCNGLNGFTLEASDEFRTEWFAKYGSMAE